MPFINKFVIRKVVIVCAFLVAAGCNTYQADQGLMSPDELPEGLSPAGEITRTDLSSYPVRLPNVVVFLSDDQGWGDLGIHGNTNLETPRIDAMARGGALLDRFYVTPVCSPTRAEFLTGRYHARSGVTGTSAGAERLNQDEFTIADTFRAAGYTTGVFGKWHNGKQYPYHPAGRGFDEFYGFASGHWGHYYSPILEHNGRLVRGNGYVVDDFTDRAMEFIEQNREQPFFVYLPYNTPHSPMQVPERFYARFRDADIGMLYQGPEEEDMAMTRAALAMCENIDWNVGRVLDKLEQLKLTENTIVIFFGDNGPNSWRWNDGMRGRKGSTDEGGVRVPFVISWPGSIEPGTRIPEIAGGIDLLPTLADLAGIPVAGNLPLDGISLKPLLTGTADDWADRMIFSNWGDRISVRTQQYRLDHNGRLYDMIADPGQQYAINYDRPDVADSLIRAAADWAQELNPGQHDDNRPFTAGYPEFPVTHLPARDGIPHGNIERSNYWPNSSFFTNWTATEDRITWDIEVETAGRYEAIIYYTIPEQDVGPAIELSFGENRLSSRVDEAFDPPLVGAEKDLVPRIESYVKDFRPLRMGEITLDKGRSLLTLRALEIPGRQVMDVRRVTLILQD